MEPYDLIVVGAGPNGLSCAIEAQKAGLNVLVLEKGTLVNSLYHYPTNMVFFSTAKLLEIGNVPFIAQNEKPTRQEALEYYRQVVEHFGLKIKLYEKVEQINRANGYFSVQTSKDLYKTRNVVLATGYFDIPNRLNVPGEDLPKVQHYFKEAHPYINQELLIVGGGNSAVEAALTCYRKGAKVTMVIRESEFKDNVKYWLLPDIRNRIKEKAIKTYFVSRVTRIFPDTVEICTPTKTLQLKNDFVLALIGYRPDYHFLERCGIEFKDDELKTPVHNEKTFESNVKGLYLAGVVCGGLNTGRWFIENGRLHARAIVEHIVATRSKTG